MSGDPCGVCPSHDAQECAEVRHRRRTGRWPDKTMEPCECECHEPEPWPEP